MKKVVGFTLSGLVALALVGAAMAQDAVDTVVQIPIGSYADYILPAVGGIVGVAILWGISKIGGPVGAILKTLITEQMLKNAVNWGVAMVQGAAKDKVLEVDVGNAVAKQAADYVLKYGPKWLIDWLGGVEGIRDRIIARLDIAPEAGLRPVSVMSGAEPIPGVIPGGK